MRVHPSERVRFVVETAKQVIDGGLPVEAGAAAVTLQAEQITPFLRADRETATRSECDSIATNLRRLAEEVNDKSSGHADPEAYLTIAKAIGEMAQALR